MNTELINSLHQSYDQVWNNLVSNPDPKYLSRAYRFLRRTAHAFMRIGNHKLYGAFMNQAFKVRDEIRRQRKL